MSIYVQTLETLFRTLPNIADSEALQQHNQAQAEIMSAYEHLDRAVTRLVVESV
ncbi:serine/threonine protein kinase [Leuconostoc citreum]|uniref:serine/threonine protein kinase n=1 Tax=Leuconostoc citreum TaxID=33964 RepID=UPI0011BB878A|nr:serine/threonine protein kinase [Leuconostoc citreum]QEA54590.1 serine/threonine protein kinase [Leuconostoc citreum]